MGLSTNTPRDVDLSMLEYFEQLYFTGSSRADADQLLAAARYVNPGWFDEMLEPLPREMDVPWCFRQTFDWDSSRSAVAK